MTHAGFTVELAHEGHDATRVLGQHSFDLCVLDIMLPGKSGLEVLRDLREKDKEMRVIALTALSDESDVIRGLEAGADDYMPKPFSPRELVARVQAQLRRATPASTMTQLELPGEIRVDLARLEVHRGDDVIPLTPREADILAYLVKHSDRVVTREDLLSEVWHYQNANIETRTVDIHIVGLRRKVEPDPSSPTLIQTVRGKGYRWYAEA